jgi:hypothetical protein
MALARIGAKEGRRAAHKVKQQDTVSHARDRHKIDPKSGNIYARDGELIGNAEEGIQESEGFPPEIQWSKLMQH